jgi:hypothetical protein
MMLSSSQNYKSVKWRKLVQQVTTKKTKLHQCCHLLIAENNNFFKFRYAIGYNTAIAAVWQQFPNSISLNNDDNLVTI